MNETILLLSLSIILVIIEIYSETHLRNYGTFLERIKYLFGLKTLFNFTKINITLIFFLNIFNSSILQDIGKIVDNITSFSYDIKSFFIIFLPSLLLTIFTVFANPDVLFNQLHVWQIRNQKVNYFISNIKYLMFRIISFALILLIFIITYKTVTNIHESFESNNMYLFDWLLQDTTFVNNYYKGTYLSLVITVVIFFVFNNAFLKLNSSSWDFRDTRKDFFKYFFISLFLCLGIFFGLFSVFNGFYNLINSGFKEWINTENLVGILPIRVSSVLVSFYLLTYIYREVLHKEFLKFTILGILPYRTLEDYQTYITFNRVETLFFSQICFYILNIAVSEYFFIIEFKSIFLGILNFSILFILDDFKIINDYSYGLQKVITMHFFRLWIFNFLMLVSSVVFFIKTDHFLLLTGYLLGSFILFSIYFKNFNSIKFI